MASLPDDSVDLLTLIEKCSKINNKYKNQNLN